MPFSFREVTISGLRQDTEGTSAALNTITDVLVNEMGWGLEDDRRTQPGNANVTLTHKVVFKNNNGESGNDVNWFITLTSGTALATDSNLIGSQIHSLYDVSIHDTATSGVETPLSHVTNTFNTDSNGNFKMWISGDKDAVVIITQVLNNFSFMTFGKSKGFLGPNIEPYGIYLHSIASTIPTTTSVKSIVSNPPIAMQNANEGEFLSISTLTNNQPRINLGQQDPIFTFFPMVHTVDDGSPIRKGAIGLVRNAWAGIGANVGWLRPSLITVSGSIQTYLGFPDTSTALVIRRS